MFNSGVKRGVLFVVLTALFTVFVGLAMVYIFGNMVFPGAKPLRPQHQVMPVLGSNIHYLEKTAPGAPIVLLHGFGGSVSGWTQVLESMQQRAVYALDLPGFGASDRPAIAYSSESISAYVRAFIEQKGLENVVLVGHSMGGVVAAHVAVAMPDTISALVLISPSGVASSLKFSVPRRFILRPGLLNRLCYGLVANRLFQQWFPHSTARQALGVTASYNQEFLSVIEAIQQPTLLLWSAGDKRVPIQYAQSYLAAIKHSRLRELPLDAGHKLDHGELIAQHIEAFSAKY